MHQSYLPRPLLTNFSNNDWLCILIEQNSLKFHNNKINILIFCIYPFVAKILVKQPKNLSLLSQKGENSSRIFEKNRGEQSSCPKIRKSCSPNIPKVRESYIPDLTETEERYRATSFSDFGRFTLTLHEFWKI